MLFISQRFCFSRYNLSTKACFRDLSGRQTFQEFSPENHTRLGIHHLQIWILLKHFSYYRECPSDESFHHPWLWSSGGRSINLLSPLWRYDTCTPGLSIMDHLRVHRAINNWETNSVSTVIQQGLDQNPLTTDSRKKLGNVLLLGVRNELGAPAKTEANYDKRGHYLHLYFYLNYSTKLPYQIGDHLCGHWSRHHASTISVPRQKTKRWPLSIISSVAWSSFLLPQST